jgi:hypothetical protein
MTLGGEAKKWLISLLLSFFFTGATRRGLQAGATNESHTRNMVSFVLIGDNAVIDEAIAFLARYAIPFSPSPSLSLSLSLSHFMLTVARS